VTRAPFNVLVIPFFRRTRQEPLYCLLKRTDAGYWQGIAGGGEEGETPIQTARRETMEETGIEGPLFGLDMRSDVPKTSFAAHVYWPQSLYVIPQHMFAVEAASQDVTLSHEHTEASWLPYEQAYELLHWQSNQNALWELSERLRKRDLRPVSEVETDSSP
jgi:dATP pyrophosphohydrolase